MGLRYRKSISLGKGLRMNIGKNGVSISAGIPGFRKTIHSSGRVTTTVGIPGSGLYYVDTDHIGKTKHQRLEGSTRPAPAKLQQPTRVKSPIEENTSLPSKVAETALDACALEAKPLIAETVDAYEPVCNADVGLPMDIVDQENFLGSEHSHNPSFRDLFENCDMPVNWIDVLANREPTDDAFDADAWEFLHSKAVSVFEGDIETMLQIVDEVCPFDDLSSFASDFNIEMEDPSELNVEFSMKSTAVPDDESQDAVCSIVIRVARDAFALLPVERVGVRAMIEGQGDLVASFDRASFAGVEFEGKDPSDMLALHLG